LLVSLDRLWRHLTDRTDRAFATLKGNGQYRWYFLGSFMLSMGFWIQNTAQAWLVLELTHSASMVGLLVLYAFGPRAAFGLFGGVVVDRYDERLVLLWSHVGLMLCAAALAILAASGDIAVGHLFAIAAIRSLLLCVEGPARTKFVRSMVGRENFTNVLGLGASGDHFARIVGPALAGLMISALGATPCFMANAVGFLAMILAVLRIRRQRPTAGGDHRRRPSPVAALVEGLRYVSGVPYLSALMLALFLMTFIPMSFGTTLPIFAVKTLGRDATAYGTLVSGLAFGSLVGSLGVASRRQTNLVWIFLCAAGLGAAQLALVFERSLIVCVPTLAFAGFFMTSFVVSISSILLSEAEDGFQGRVGSLSGYVVQTIGPLGSSISGWLSDVGGTDLAFGVGACFAIATAATGALVKRAVKPAPQT